MKINKFVLFILLNLTFNSFSQEFSEKVISKYKSDTINFDFVANLSVIDSSVNQQDILNYKSKLDDVIQNLPEKENNDRKEKKRIKKIYDIIHDNFFVKYEIVADFPEIFRNGTYNCVTSTAVYAHVFEKLKIPYLIKEEPTHVFIIAYPETYNIHLETTVPSEFGFQSMKDSEIEEIVDNLLKLKLISQSEITQKGAKEVYMEYFYGNNFVDKSSLIGMQYYNRALEFYENEEYEKALSYVTKSNIYHSSGTVEYFKKTLSFLVLDTRDYSDIESVRLLFTIFSDFEYGKDYEDHDINYFSRKITGNEENDVEFLIQAAEILKNLKDEKVKNIFLENLYYEIMTYSLTSEDLDNGLAYAKKLLKINAENKRAEEAILYVLKKRITILPISDNTISKIEDLEQEYHGVKKDVTIQSYKCYNFLRLADNAFKTRDYKNGESYITKLEKTIEDFEGSLLVNHEYIAMGYLSAGIYFYKFNKLDKALKYLNRGLEYSPDNKDLNKYLKWTKEEM